VNCYCVYGIVTQNSKYIVSSNSVTLHYIIITALLCG